MKTIPSVCLCWVLLLLSSPGLLRAQRFYSDDPVWFDPDNRHIAEPAARDISKAWDFLESTYLKPHDQEPKPAVNANTLGEVPDSSWFTNRIGRNDLSIDELVRGPNTREGPDLSRSWEILSGKDEGATPGFWIRDGRGDVYLLKFDPVTHPQITTSAEVISTKFLYAAGYYVPENYLVRFRPEQLRIRPDSRFTDRYGVRRKIEERDLKRTLQRVPRLPDGTIQALASLRLSGRPLGPFKFHGTRPDDPNDIFPHQDRRELRGYRVFSAWLHHNDSDAANSLDMLVEEGGRRFIRHHLIDFGTTLGSGASGPKSEFTGNEYFDEWRPILKTALTFGFWHRPWMSAEYPDLPSVGRFEARHFHPHEWKPDYPNPAFDKMDLEDALWATRIVMRFTDEMIRAIVKAGRFLDLRAQEYVTETLIRRRDKIVEYYLAQLNPLDGFEVRGDEPLVSSLEFINLGLEAGLSDNARYEYRWFGFDNEEETLHPLGAAQSSASASIPPPLSSGAEYLMVRIRTFTPGQPNWEKPVDVFVRLGPSPKVVGVDRHGERAF